LQDLPLKYKFLSETDCIEDIKLALDAHHESYFDIPWPFSRRDERDKKYRPKWILNGKCKFYSRFLEISKGVGKGSFLLKTTILFSGDI
jgi:hypothetical protein